MRNQNSGHFEALLKAPSLHTLQSSCFVSHSAEETRLIGLSWGKQLQKGTILAFFGDLGVGKTTLIQGIAQALKVSDSQAVCSPTFSLLHAYSGTLPLYHFDLYRLPEPQEFFQAGFNEYFDADGICCIEWAEKLEGHLPAHAQVITISHLEENTRRISLKSL